MKKVEIQQVDVFTKKAFAGNPAAVVTDASNLSDAEMQSIAKEMNLSETAFVLSSEKADLKIRWFTTEKEVLFCGHATVASFHVLAEKQFFGMERDGIYAFKLECLVGILDVEVEIAAREIKVRLFSPEPKLTNENIDKEELVQILGCKQEDFLDKVQIQRDSIVDYLFVGLKSLASLNEIKYNYSALKDYGDSLKVKGFVIYTLETYEADSHVHSRFFSPYYDVIEDPVTGSANGPLAVLVYENGLLNTKTNLPIIKAEQGDVLGRPGRLLVELIENQNGKLQPVLVGEAVTVMDGVLRF